MNDMEIRRFDNLREVEEMFESGDKMGTLLLIDSLLKESPDDMMILCLKSTLHESMGDWQGAILQAAIMIALNPNELLGFSRLVSILCALQYYDTADLVAKSQNVRRAEKRNIRFADSEPLVKIVENSKCRSRQFDEPTEQGL